MYKMITFLAFVASLVWAVKKPDYDSVAAAIVALAAFVGVFYVGERKQQARQIQEVGAGGIGIQAGRDVKLGKFTKK